MHTNRQVHSSRSETQYQNSNDEHILQEAGKERMTTTKTKNTAGRKSWLFGKHTRSRETIDHTLFDPFYTKKKCKNPTQSQSIPKTPNRMPLEPQD